MKTVKEISEITGISIRILRYYDEIGLLKPTQLSEAKYRLYDNKALEKLQEIMFFKEVGMSLDDIKRIMDNSNYDRKQAMLTQKFLLEQKRNRLNGSIEKFRESFTANFKDEKRVAEIIKLYGSKDKALEACLQTNGDKEVFTDYQKEIDNIYHQFAVAMKLVKRLAEANKVMFHLDNSRHLLLKMAADYLNNGVLVEATDEQYGVGVTEYIGQVIKKYYGI